ncbi:MAG: 5-bromo-4-chloroindolyl phosphate hydrolysis family protein [Defluviitaleaceae bacterium]|nr:5-bromo-4-chloroindolyl phosphate hydrolysis family protein [Defluviitaleaceae bacterium]
MTERSVQKRIKSVIPIYGMGVVFFLYALILPMYRITDLIIALALSICCYIFLNKLFPGTVVEIEMPYQSGDKDVDQVLTTGREYIQQLENLKEMIQDTEVSSKITNLQNISKQIFDYISKNPTQVRKINTFMNFYYPTALKFLDHFAEHDNNKVKGENIQSSLNKTKESLSQFEEAFAHQLDNLYSDKALDIETDIVVLQNLMKQERL